MGSFSKTKYNKNLKRTYMFSAELFKIDNNTHYNFVFYFCSDLVLFSLVFHIIDYNLWFDHTYTDYKCFILTTEYFFPS